MGWFDFDELPVNMVEVARERTTDVGGSKEATFLTQEGKSNSDLRAAT